MMLLRAQPFSTGVKARASAALSATRVQAGVVLMKIFATVRDIVLLLSALVFSTIFATQGNQSAQKGQVVALSAERLLYPRSR
jgi:hypothetical protein